MSGQVNMISDQFRDVAKLSLETSNSYNRRFTSLQT